MVAAKEKLAKTLQPVSNKLDEKGISCAKINESLEKGNASVDEKLVEYPKLLKLKTGVSGVMRVLDTTVGGFFAGFV